VNPAIPDTPGSEHFANTPAVESGVGSIGGGGSAASMISFLNYQGKRYTPASLYRLSEAPALRELIGEKLGYASGIINERSNIREYAAEFSGTVSGDINSVIGYSDQFRLCSVSDITFADGKDYELLLFYEAFDEDELVYGSDLFDEYLQLNDKWVQVKYVGHSQWNSTHPQEYIYQDLHSVTEEDVNSFIAELLEGCFVNINEAPERDGFYTSNAQAHLYFFLSDNTRIDIRLVQGGYVGYQHFIWHYVRMPGEAFDVIFNACQ